MVEKNSNEKICKKNISVAKIMINENMSLLSMKITRKRMLYFESLFKPMKIVPNLALKMLQFQSLNLFR